MVLNEKIEVLGLVGVFKTLLSLRTTWKTKTPYQKWCFYYSVGHFAAFVVDFPLNREDQTLSCYSYFSLFYIALYSALVVYTIVYYTSIGDPMQFFPCTCFFAILMAVSIQISLHDQFNSRVGTSYFILNY